MRVFAIICLGSAATLSVEAACAARYKQCGGKGYTGPTCCAEKGDTCQVEIKDGKPNIYYSQCRPSSTPAPTKAGACSSTYKQCGGKNYTGPTKCCTSGDTCQVEIKSDGSPNIYYSQCRPGATSKPTPKPTPSGDACSITYKQCGGKNWTGPTNCCTKGDTCQVEIKDGVPNIWYSQCRPGTATTSKPTTAKPTTAKPTTSGDGCSATWKQCGGKTWTGPKCCTKGNTCQVQIQADGTPNIYYSQCIPSSSTVKPTAAPKPTPKPTTSKTSKPTPITCSNGKSCGFLGAGAFASSEGNDGTFCCADNEECYLDPLNIKGPTECAIAKDRYVCEVTGQFVTGYTCNYAFDADSSLISQPSVCCKTATDGCYYNADKSYMQCTPNICKAGETKCGYTYTGYWTGSSNDYVISPPTTCCSATQVCGPSKPDGTRYICSDFSCPTGQVGCGFGTFEGSPGHPNNICCAVGEVCLEDGSAHGTTSYCAKA